MTEQEKINAEVQMKLALQDAKFNVFMQEMRDRDNQRAEDIRELRQEMKDLQKSIDSKIDNIQNNVQNMQNNMQNMLNSNRNLNIVTILGVAAIVIAVLLK
ncbi:MAG: hypothetical protein IKD80_09045 [Selenomonadaceae bacterium]|nr:hypothetical protein [Selenomonadaceae bacterium]